MEEEKEEREGDEEEGVEEEEEEEDLQQCPNPWAGEDLPDLLQVRQLAVLRHLEGLDAADASKHLVLVQAAADLQVV